MSHKVWVSSTQWVWADAIKYKDPNDVLDYCIDLADGGSNDGTSSDTGWLQSDTISSVTWTIPSGITKDSSTNTTTKATIWLSGGTAGSDYPVSARFTTASGRTHDVTLLIKVVNS